MADVTELEQLQVRLSGDAAQYQKMLAQSAQATTEAAGKIEREASRIESAFGSLKTAAAGFLATLGVGALVKGAFSNFAEAEQISLKLNAALEANGREVAKVRADYEEFAKALQRVTTTEDDAALSMLQTAESMGLTGLEAKRAVKNAVALAAAKGGEAQSYLRVTTALEQGHTEMLARYLPALRDIKDESERAALAQDLLNKMFGTARAEAQSSAGSIQQLKNEWGNFLEEAGAVVADVIKPFVSGARNAIAAASEWLQSMGGLEGMWGSVKEAAVAAWDWVAPVRDALASLFGTIKELAFDAFDKVKTFASETWNAIGLDGIVSWEAVRDTIQDTILFAEFTLRNFEQVAAFVWTSFQLGAVIAFNVVEHFFTQEMPAFLDWFATNWRTIFEDAFNFATTVFKNLGTNIVELVKNIPGLIAGTVNFEDIWKPLTEGFERLSPELILPERVMGELEMQLRKEAEAQQKALAESFESFKQGKLIEFESARELLPDDVKKQTKDDALDLGTALGKSITDKVKEATKEVQKFDAALAGSAEAASRIAAFRDSVSGDRMFKGQSLRDVKEFVDVNAQPEVVEPVAPKEFDIDIGGDEIVGVLERIEVLLERDDADSIVLRSAGVLA